jgi:hypothetical protein
MSTMRRLAAAMVVVLGLALAVSTTCQASVTTKRLAARDVSTTPTGWVPVAYGNAQISVPATWSVHYRSFKCPSGNEPGEVFVNPLPGYPPCPRPLKMPMTVALQAPATPRPPKDYGPKQAINGITVYGETSHGAGDYLVPSLGVEVMFQGSLGSRVLHSLARSPRTVVLANGPEPSVPPSWRTMTFGGVRVSVPPAWRVERESVYVLSCVSPQATFGAPEVVLDTDARLSAPGCPIIIPPQPSPPSNGLRIDSGPSFPAATMRFTSTHCVNLHGLTACPATSPAYSILVLEITVPGHSKAVHVSIGLAGDGMVARTVLYSLRAA